MQVLAQFEKPILHLELDRRINTLLIQFADGSWASLIPTVEMAVAEQREWLKDGKHLS